MKKTLIWLALMLFALSAVSDDRVCKISMRDSLNKITSTITAQLVVQEDDVREFLVVDNYSWKEIIIIDALGRLKTTAGVPEYYEKDVLSHYEMKNNNQLTFSELDGSQCTKLLKSLIMFMIMEWFYFG